VPQDDLEAVCTLALHLFGRVYAAALYVKREAPAWRSQRRKIHARIGALEARLKKKIVAKHAPLTRLLSSKKSLERKTQQRTEQAAVSGKKLFKI
jgi:hypothetical protein